MNQAIFALVDCNNFFVSCERVFRPDLEGKPVVVLSSNDGCAVARSNEVKALGIPMGAPAFKYRQVLEQNKVVQFSANFELYGDISRRITQILTDTTPRTEVYSIDESFLDLSQLASKNFEEQMREVRNRIWQEVGIPVSIGIAPTKTLAKLASERAKKDSSLSGVLDLYSCPTKTIERHSEQVPVEDVWGIGRRFAPKLRSQGIANAKELARMRTKHARQIMGLRGEQTVRELGRQACFPLERLHTRAKSIARTRTFGEDTNEFNVLESAIANFAVRAAFSLRVSGQCARRAGLFLMTNRHKPGFRSWSSEVVFDVPTSDSGYLTSTLVATLEKLYSKNQLYHRAGVWLGDFVPNSLLQTDLLGNVSPKEYDRSQARMKALDELNERYGRGTLHFAAEDLTKSWHPKQNLRSPHYVSDWNDLPSVRVKA